MIRSQCQHRIDLAFIRELIGASERGLFDRLCADIVITFTIILIALCAGIYWAIGKYDTYSLAFFRFFMAKPSSLPSSPAFPSATRLKKPDLADRARFGLYVS